MTEHIYQKTIAKIIEADGIGLHSGKPIHMTLKPADPNTGIVFFRVDVTDKDNCVPAKWDHVVDTRMNTCLGNASAVVISTVEHFMGALAGLGVTNLAVELSGPELPLMDGSARDFVTLLEEAGVVKQSEPVKALKILKAVEFSDGKGATTRLDPADSGLSFKFEIDFPQTKIIGHQQIDFDLNEAAFKQLIAPARTFGFAAEVEQLRAMGLAQGASLENAIAIQGDSVLNPGGLRDANEFVEHKVLDAIGDLYEAGMPIIGRFTGVKSGHFHNNQLLRAVFADPANYEIVTL
ncbi:MAG: UDP-3-O-[Alphaproteobacteria bacterium]|nr:UDP-3-O-[3-hydroxymyristoyl] N-acetylglucosamine deacetylase [Alphaproteobacteria bacterium]